MTPEAEIEALRARITATRWPDQETVADHSQGPQLAAMQALARYWATEYDWRKCEAKLNALPHFMTEIDGLNIHFIHVRSEHENACRQTHASDWRSLNLRHAAISVAGGIAAPARFARRRQNLWE